MCHHTWHHWFLDEPRMSVTHQQRPTHRPSRRLWRHLLLKDRNSHSVFHTDSVLHGPPSACFQFVLSSQSLFSKGLLHLPGKNLATFQRQIISVPGPRLSECTQEAPRSVSAFHLALFRAYLLEFPLFLWGVPQCLVIRQQSLFVCFLYNLTEIEKS